MLANGMTTFGERDGISRSECHAWSASPCFDLLHTVAGIFPLAPGFRSIAIAPNFGNLETMNVVFPHPSGDLKMELKKKRGNSVEGTILLPEGTTGEFMWKGKSISLMEGENYINTIARKSSFLPKH